MGLATAQVLFGAGYSIALVDLNASALESVASELNNSSGTKSQKAWPKVCDVGSSAALKELFEEAKKELGPIYGVAHCAGILGPMMPVHVAEEAALDKVGAFNLLSQSWDQN
jgi:NAD(P)-dependent dehydrogenase (short-subunit alcohol dehydrogenase family)